MLQPWCLKGVVLDACRAATVSVLKKIMLFSKFDFVSHSGLPLNWKIDCDALTDDDLNTLAFVISQKFKFGSVVGIPTGGIRLETALRPYITTGPRLLVDDVLTTGKSMGELYEDGDVGVVIFARGECPYWIYPLLKVNTFYV